MHQYNLRSKSSKSTEYTNLSNYCSCSDDNGYASGDYGMQDVQQNEDDHWEVDDEYGYGNYQALMNELLRDPLTPEERASYTKYGIMVKVEKPRVKEKKWPGGRVNNVNWNPISIKNAFDSWLRKFGTRTDDYLCQLIWDEQESPFCISWSDLSSLNIPWNRTGFKLHLDRIKASRKRKAEYGDKDNVSDRKRRKENKNTVKNMEMREARRRILDILDEKYVRWLRGYAKRRSLMARLIHLYLREGWDKDMIQSLLFDNYTAFDIKDKINANHRNLKDVNMTRSEINGFTKSIMNDTTDNVKPDLRNTGDSNTVNKRYWETVFDKEMDKDLKQLGFDETTDNKQSVDNMDQSLASENKELKSEIGRLRLEMEKLKNCIQDNKTKIEDI